MFLNIAKHGEIVTKLQSDLFATQSMIHHQKQIFQGFEYQTILRYIFRKLPSIYRVKMRKLAFEKLHNGIEKICSIWYECDLMYTFSGVVEDTTDNNQEISTPDALYQVLVHNEEELTPVVSSDMTTAMPSVKVNTGQQLKLYGQRHTKRDLRTFHIV